jgi:hypothetical protein
MKPFQGGARKSKSKGSARQLLWRALKIHMHLVVIKMLGWIFNPGVSMDGWDFDFFRELIGMIHSVNGEDLF